MNLDSFRHTPPATDAGLWNWVYAFTGVQIAREHVCRGHQPPFDAFRTWWFDQPLLALMLGPRGGGKSFLSAIHTHCRSRWTPGHGTRILGGSKAQSQQIYDALKKAIRDGKGPLGSDHDSLAELYVERARYHNGSNVEILAASSRSVRGPHIPLLKLDEIDEIDPEHREAAMGMCVADKARGIRASATLTSTWHKVGGPMSGLIEDARRGKFPFHQFCIFEVLERCPKERSGPNLEKCPECPIFKWCHEDIGDDPQRRPKAKRSNGHYDIDALIQKAIGTSPRIFEADYLCTGPKADGLWFKAFTRARHVSEAAEFDPLLPVHLAVDSGVHTGGVLFQVATAVHLGKPRPLVKVFSDYYCYDKPARTVAGEIIEVTRERCNGRRDEATTDPAGGSRNPVGPTVMGEYEAAGLRLKRWPHGSVADGLALIESLLESADGFVGILIHPRCTRLAQAFENYGRAKRGSQYVDAPEDPQHPHEDLMDALRGGLRNKFPRGVETERQYHGRTSGALFT